MLERRLWLIFELNSKRLRTDGGYLQENYRENEELENTNGFNLYLC